MRKKTLALAAAIALAASAIHAQPVQPQRAGQPPSAPQTTRDLKGVLYDLQNSLGMLKGLQEVDAVLTMELWGTGTISAGGQTGKLTAYRASLDFSAPGMRVDFTRDGQRQVQVVSGKYAWNEATPGKNPVPAAGTLGDRLTQLWLLTPQGLAKAAKAAGANTKIGVEGTATTLAFPLPAPAMGTAKISVNAKNQIDRAEVRNGTTITEATYSDYGDWNDADAKGDVYLPRHIVVKQGTMTLLDLNLSRTNTYNPYIVVPVPDNIEKVGSQ
jgi:hypothetical protein